MSETRHPLRHGDLDLDLVCRHVQGALEVTAGGDMSRLTSAGDEAGRLVLSDGERMISGAVEVHDERVVVSWRGRSWVLERRDVQARGGSTGSSDGTGSGHIEAPMTGTVIEVCCEAGDAVAAGATVVVVEAMKMEHRLVAPAASSVTEVECAAGDQVDIGQILVRLEPDA